MQTITEIRSRDVTRYGITYPGTVMKGVHADIDKGKSIRIYGTMYGWRSEPADFDLTFAMGDEAEHGSYNLVYTGDIVSIGAKTVTVDDHGTRHRMTLADFISKNWDFDAKLIFERNADTMWRI